MAEEIDLEKCNFRTLRSHVNLTLDRVILHTVMHQSLTSIYTPNFIEIGKKLFVDGRTDVPTDGRTFPPLMLLGRLGGVDLKRLMLQWTHHFWRPFVTHWLAIPQLNPCTKFEVHSFTHYEDEFLKRYSEHAPFKGWLVVGRIGLAMINLSVKFEISILFLTNKECRSSPQSMFVPGLSGIFLLWLSPGMLKNFSLLIIRQIPV